MTKMLSVEGWTISLEDRTVERFRLSWDGRELEHFEVTTGIPSPDVEAAFPQLLAVPRRPSDILASHGPMAAGS